MKHTSLAIIASALLAFGSMSIASANEAHAAPTEYSVHVHIIKVDSNSGKVAVLSDANLSTLSGKAVPFKMLQDTAYVASVTATIDAKGKNIGESIVPGHAEAGLKMSVTPITMPNGAVKVEYAYDLSSLVAMKSITVKGKTIQLPTIDYANGNGAGIVGVGSPLTFKAGDKVVTITISKA
ncbi:hypothetical protein AB7849_09285 [Rhodanobacter sp. 115]|uniref:hypothetical protein n=1 Tax=Rhodanobacter sp. FW021-MT20 TaxID=1162282 RepID=UPI0034E5F6A8